MLRLTLHRQDAAEANYFGGRVARGTPIKGAPNEIVCVAAGGADRAEGGAKAARSFGPPAREALRADDPFGTERES